jgi:ribosomal protein S12 methylthiotransferase accessory factor
LAHAPDQGAAHALHAALLAQAAPPREHTYLAPMAPLLGQILALEAIKVLSGYMPSLLAGCLQALNLVTLETTRHAIVPMPWCEVCGGASAGLARGQEVQAPVDLRADPGSLRERLAGWVDARTGVIGALYRGVPGPLDPEPPIIYFAAPAAYTEGAYPPPAPIPPTVGTGLSETEALIAAAGAAIARYAAARYRAGDLRRAAFAELGDAAFDPRHLVLYEPSQYDNPYFIFAPFDPQQPLDWVRGTWLDSGDSVWLPALPVYMSYQAPPEEQFCQVTSNGLAAGPTWEDAALRAMYELVARDAFMLTWLCRLPARRLALDDSVDPGAHEVARQVASTGAVVELYLLDAGTGIPAILCCGFGDGVRWPGAAVGLAAHADPSVAVRQAILDLAQLGPAVRRHAEAADARIPGTALAVQTPPDHALYYAQPARARAFTWLRSAPDPALPIGALGVPHDGSIGWCVSRLGAAGARIAAADLTGPDVAHSPFRVVRALGVAMQPVDFGHAYRRLANPRLRALAHEPLNPYPHPLA